jgi:hypothetical protein
MESIRSSYNAREGLGITFSGDTQYPPYLQWIDVLTYDDLLERTT